MSFHTTSETKSLRQAVLEVSCDGLRNQLDLFLEWNSKLALKDFHCPICFHDLRQCMKALSSPPHKPGLGKCTICLTKYQLVSRIEHKDHEGCFMEISYPLILLQPELQGRLRLLWLKMLPGPHGLSDAALARWIEACSEVLVQQVG